MDKTCRDSKNNEIKPNDFVKASKEFTISGIKINVGELLGKVTHTSSDCIDVEIQSKEGKTVIHVKLSDIELANDPQS